MVMKLTVKTTGMLNMEDLKKMIKDNDISVGDELTINDCEWRVLDVQEDRILIWKHTGITDHVFNDNWSNVYEGSDIQKYLQTDFKETMPEELREFDYFLLSLDDIMKYMPREIDRICCDSKGETDWWWTSTPYVGGGSYVRNIGPSGNVNYSGAYNSNGVAPACWIHL